MNFGIVKCESGKSNDIFEAFKKLLNDFDAWKCISMIICDTTAYTGPPFKTRFGSFCKL